MSENREHHTWLPAAEPPRDLAPAPVGRQPVPAYAAYQPYGQPYPAHGQPAPPGVGGPWPSPRYGAPFPPLQLASWGHRAGAILIDSLIICIPYLAAVLVMIFTTADGSEPPLWALLTALGGLAGTYAVWIWDRILRQGRTGQSIGKRVVGIRLVAEQTGAPPGRLMTFTREMAHYFDGAVYIGYLWPLWDARRRTFADMLCTTVVVHA